MKHSKIRLFTYKYIYSEIEIGELGPEVPSTVPGGLPTQGVIPSRGAGGPLEGSIFSTGTGGPLECVVLGLEIGKETGVLVKHSNL